MGNGINLLGGLTDSWLTLVKELHGVAASDEFPKMAVTPFPLLVEEACNPRFTHTGELAFQTELAGRLHQWEPGRIHAECLELAISHILTVNYDHTLEKASGKPFGVEAPLVQEKRYSLFRRNLLHDGKKVWHIHGDIACPRTMVLGYDHYAGHVQALREVVVRGYRRGGRTYGPLKRTLRTLKEVDPTSWVEVALTHHLVMIGLDLSFAEFGLWWLLSYRARRRNLSENNLPMTQLAYFTKKEPDADGRRTARASQLRNCEVEVIEIDGSWSDVYASALEHCRAQTDYARCLTRARC